MTDIKKKHHFVPQSYLKNWANEKNQVSVLRNNKIFRSSISDTLQENKFYNLDISLSEKQIQLIKIWLTNTNNQNSAIKSAEKVINTLIKTIQHIDLYNEIKKILPDDSNKNQLEKDLLLFQANTFENYFSIFEEKFSIVMNKILSKKFQELTWKDYDLLAQFIALQLCRTPKTQNNIKNGIIELKNTIEKKINSTISKEEIEGIVKFYSLILVPAQLNNAFLYNNMIFYVIENTTNLNYITSDQPVFNLLTPDDKDKMRFSVPLSPKILLKCEIFPMQQEITDFLHQQYQNDRDKMKEQLEKMQTGKEKLEDTGQTIYNSLLFYLKSSNEYEIYEQNNLINLNKNLTLVAISNDDLKPYKNE